MVFPKVLRVCRKSMKIYDIRMENVIRENKAGTCRFKDSVVCTFISEILILMINNKLKGITFLQ